VISKWRERPAITRPHFTTRCAPNHRLASFSYCWVDWIVLSRISTQQQLLQLGTNTVMQTNRQRHTESHWLIHTQTQMYTQWLLSLYLVGADSAQW